MLNRAKFAVLLQHGWSRFQPCVGDLSVTSHSADCVALAAAEQLRVMARPLNNRDVKFLLLPWFEFLLHPNSLKHLLEQLMLEGIAVMHVGL